MVTPPGVKQDYNEPLAWLFPLCTFCHRYQILLQKNLYALDFHINHHRVNQSVAGMNVRAVKMPLDEGGHSWFIGSCAICAFQVDNESSSRTFMVSRVMRRRTMITFWLDVTYTLPFFRSQMRFRGCASWWRYPSWAYWLGKKKKRWNTNQPRKCIS